MVVFVPAAVRVCVSDVMGQQESEVEEELCEDAGDGEEDASDEDYEDCLKNEDEDEEARGRSPTSLNSEASFSMTVEVIQVDQRLQPWTLPDVFYMLTLSITCFIVFHHLTKLCSSWIFHPFMYFTAFIVTLLIFTKLLFLLLHI